MQGGLFWRAARVQALLVGALFVVLALAVPHGFFADYGILVGPLAWVGCALVPGRLLSLPLTTTATAAGACRSRPPRSPRPRAGWRLRSSAPRSSTSSRCPLRSAFSPRCARA